MNKKQLISALEALDMRPGRGLGQNFLLDGNLLDFIVRASALTAGERVLEVGPGFGALTEKLLAAKGRVTAVEFDHRLADYLRKRFDGKELEIIEADACRVDYHAVFGDEPFKAIANLPYAISSVFIAALIDGAAKPQSMLFMLQKEMGERLAAAPGSKAYGALSVRCQLRYDVSLVRIVPPEVFYPAPEVDSALVKFVRHDRYDLGDGIGERADAVVKLAFSQRRKQLGKVLGRGGYDPEKVAAAFAETGFPLEIRPDRIGVEGFYQLGRLLRKESLCR
ncbi:MAG: 16S rRNA (adenine(1518)-N(6)/adenine(1519)-N(6))-dimethyltransferase RsmA [Victivallaceae bacterium]|nr:16S rRNA (adenine(1518)-N(6)/adenine(1519)-N(6))-dimethyltransferase RsmA [Victivallaceae bacterium]